MYLAVKVSKLLACKQLAYAQFVIIWANILINRANKSLSQPPNMSSTLYQPKIGRKRSLVRNIKTLHEVET